MKTAVHCESSRLLDPKRTLEDPYLKAQTRHRNRVLHGCQALFSATLRSICIEKVNRSAGCVVTEISKASLLASR